MLFLVVHKFFPKDEQLHVTIINSALQAHLYK